MLPAPRQQERESTMGNAKIQGDQLDQLYTMLDEVVERNGREKLEEHKKHLVTDERVKDLGKRFRWDILWAADPAARDGWFSLLYASGGHDAHVDTALRGWTAARAF